MKRLSRPNPRSSMTAPVRRVRFAWVAILFCVWVGMIGLRLVWLQVIKSSEWVDRAAHQQNSALKLAPQRGVLYDRNLRELAMTVQVDSIFAVPTELGENRAEAAEMLAKLVHTDPNDAVTSSAKILARFNDSRNFAWVARRVDATTAQRVRELNLKGVYFQKEFKRFYPNDDLAAQVLGYVGADDTGLGGLELLYDDDMHGVPGSVWMAVDAKRHVMESKVKDEPLPGENLVLSIDANMQYIAERALDKQMAKTHAAHGTVVVQDPHTGQILALAISPRFNPNDRHHMDASVLNNLAVSNPYEPGSTFKLVTYAAAIDGAGVQPTDMVDCQGGSMTMFGRTLHDDKSDHYGVITVQQALEHSSDVGAAKMALKLGANRFYDYIKAFGFGERTGVELPSETRGLLRAPRNWKATSILSVSIGQEVSVTPVQLVTMVSTIANGGVYMPPHVLLQSTDELKGDSRLRPEAFHPQNQLPATLPDGAHRVITELTSGKMRSMMQGIVVEGTGKAAALNGYSSGGKTGTAQIFDQATRTYSHSKLVASFAGFAPINNPAISVAVIIDTPQGSDAQKYGAYVSAPVFAEVAQQVLEYLGVPHDQPVKPAKDLHLPAAKDLVADGPSENSGDLNAMFEEINNLPADDPLRAAPKTPVEAALAGPSEADARIADAIPAKVLANYVRGNGNDSSSELLAAHASTLAAAAVPRAAPIAHGAVALDAGPEVAVPSFSGADLRKVVETAESMGLRIEPVGSGVEREQFPAAGTRVPLGTNVVVRFSR